MEENENKIEGEPQPDNVDGIEDEIEISTEEEIEEWKEVSFHNDIISHGPFEEVIPQVKDLLKTVEVLASLEKKGLVTVTDVNDTPSLVKFENDSSVDDVVKELPSVIIWEKSNELK